MIRAATPASTAMPRIASTSLTGALPNSQVRASSSAELHVTMLGVQQLTMRGQQWWALQDSNLGPTDYEF